MLESYLKKLDAERLQDIIKNLYTVLTEEQRVELESLIHKSVQGIDDISEGLSTALPVRMSQELLFMHGMGNANKNR
ncbi:MAG: hypothetical protein R3Y67_06700 [Eubacteriales bacterium]